MSHREFIFLSRSLELGGGFMSPSKRNESFRLCGFFLRRSRMRFGLEVHSECEAIEGKLSLCFVLIQREPEASNHSRKSSRFIR